MPFTTRQRKRDEHGRDTEPRCPGCGRVLDAANENGPLQLHCPDCEALLWCRMRVEPGLIVLDVVPGTRPEVSDISAVGRSLPVSRDTRGVIVNLRGLETVNSAFLAGMLALQRLMDSSGYRLILCGLHAHVLSILQRLNLHQVLTIRNSEQDAASTL